MIGIDGRWLSFTEQPDGLVAYEFFEWGELRESGECALVDMEERFDRFVRNSLN